MNSVLKNITTNFYYSLDYRLPRIVYIYQNFVQ